MEYKDTEHTPAPLTGMETMPRFLKSKPAEWGLACIAFIEATFAPIIVDPFLIAMVLAKRSAWKRYAFIAAGWSVLGGVAGYLLGVLFFDLIGQSVIALYQLEDAFQRTQALFQDSVFFMTLVGAFTPLPYKIFALTAGVMQVNIALFVLASVIGRFGRFFLVAYVVQWLGEHATARLNRVINIGTAVLVAGAVIYGIVQLAQ